MNNELITVVIPIYNVEKYIKKCIESIIKQTYNKLEILLIDDGATDSCPKICDEYQKKDKRIKVIHKKNGGLSEARNCGIDIATGKYITFIDSDDYIDKMYIEKLYTAIKKEETKVSQCNILKVDNKENEIEKIGYSNSIVKSGKKLIEETYFGHWIENVVVWNKMYAVELFNDLRYPVGKIHEDEFITYKILYKLEKVAIINEFLYNYRQSEDSIVGKRFNVKRLDLLEALENKTIFFKNKNEQKLYELTLEKYLQKIRENYIKTKLFIEGSKSVQKDLIIKYREYYKDFIKLKGINKLSKIKMTLFYIKPNIFYKLRKKMFIQ